MTSDMVQTKAKKVYDSFWFELGHVHSVGGFFLKNKWLVPETRRLAAEEGTLSKKTWLQKKMKL